MLTDPVENLSADDFDFTYVLRNYDRTSSIIKVEYYSDNPAHTPVSITFHAINYVNSDGSFNEERFHSDVKRQTPIYHWRTMEAKPDYNENFKEILNVTYSSKASEVEAILADTPTEQPFGFPEKLHQLNKLRNLYLYSSDWIDLPSCQLDEETKNKWKIWRQEIRDMVDDTTPTDIDPTKLPISEPPCGWKDFLNENIIVYPGMNTFGMKPYSDEDVSRMTLLAANS